MQLAKSATKANPSDYLQKIWETTYRLQMERQMKSIVGGKILGGLVEIYDLENLVIISDLHGDSNSLFRILSEIDYEKFLSNPMNKLVFLGDYIDRGSDSTSIIYSICYLKGTYPDSVVLMRGNHEAPAEFPFSPHDFPYEIEDRFGNSWKEIYRKLLAMFTELTLATLVGQRLLLVHGGLPTEDNVLVNFRQSIALAQKNHFKNRVFEEILWNDPRQIDDIQNQEKSRRGFGRYFGPEMTRKWLQASGAKTIVRGHEPCYGFKLDHDNLIITLFSCREAYPNFKAAYLSLSAVNLDTISDAKDLSLYVKFLV